VWRGDGEGYDFIGGSGGKEEEESREATAPVTTTVADGMEESVATTQFRGKGQRRCRCERSTVVRSLGTPSIQDY
jgi:hypothetical protein